jgi:APA family basic amino acid/polyamine antiporter
MLGVMWAYNGWNEITYVAEEVKDPQRNLPRAIIGGIGIIALLYIGVNATYFYVLGPTQITALPASASVASEVVLRSLGAGASSIMAGAMAASIFGSLLLASLVGARIPFAMARDGVFVGALAHLSSRTRVPVRALVAQAIWSSVLVLSGSYDVITDYAIFAVLIFVALATASVFVFRRRLPDLPRAYRTWGYPVVPVLFLLVAVWILINTLMTTPGRAVAGLGLMAAGLPFYWYWTRAAEGSRGAADTRG